MTPDEWAKPIPLGQPTTGRTRAPRGTGSIYEDRTRGRWIASVEVPTQRGEPRRRRSFVGRTREAVEGRLAEHLEANPPPKLLGRAAYIARARTLGSHTDAEWWALVRSVKKVCHYCGVTTEAVFGDAKTDPLHTEKDHLVPVSRGGSDSIDNIVVSCRGCNAEKGTMTADEYLAWKAAQRG